MTFRKVLSTRDMDTSRCANSIISDSQSESDDTTRVDANFIATESAMVVLDHHNYDDVVNDGCERIALASALVAMDKPEYEIGKGWGHALYMR